jgi:hypothetical protein
MVQLSACAPHWETLHPCPNCPSTRSQEPNETSYGSEASRSRPMTGSSLPHLHRRPNDKPNTGSSDPLLSRPSTSLAAYVHPTISSKNQRRVACSCNSTTPPRQKRCQFCTVAAQSHFGGSKVSGKRQRGVDQRSFELIDENTHSTTEINDQRDESTSVGQPLVALLDDGFSESLTWSDVLTSADDIAGPISKHAIEQVLSRTSDDSSQIGFRELSQSRSGSSPKFRILQDAFGDAGPCSPEAKNCMKVAIGILRALHIPSSTCLKTRHEFPSSKASHPRMIDSVLSTNREAIRLISDMLKCTCSSSSQLQLLLAVILHKMMIWYRATIQSNLSGNESDSFPQSSAAQSLSKHTYGYQAERVSHLPIKLGEFTFDAALESKMRGQIIQNELQHLRCLVDKLSNFVQEPNTQNYTSLGSPCQSIKSCSTVSSETSTPSEKTRIAGNVRRSFHEFLRGQLEIAKVETNVYTEQ